MLAYQSGDYASFEELYRRYSGRVYGFLSRKMNYRHEAEEVHQQAFMKLHSARQTYSREYLFSQWLFVIVKTSLLDFWRKGSRQKTVENEFVHDAAIALEPSPAVGAASVAEVDLEVLSPAQREAVRMRYLEELSYEQIAQRLDRSSVSVRQLVSRALRLLRSDVKKEKN